jgi:hypothetical protein
MNDVIMEEQYEKNLIVDTKKIELKIRNLKS